MKESFTTQKFIGGSESVTVTKMDDGYEFVMLNGYSKTHTAKLVLKPFSDDM